MERILCVLIGYICGLFQTSYLYGKVHGIDIRNYGSGNAGTTNALRTLGAKAGAITLLGDCFKCVIAVVIVHLIFGKGGKGIAATAGLLLSFDLRLTLVAAIVFLAVFFLTHYVSLGSLLVYVVFVAGIIIMGQNGQFTGMSQANIYEMYVLAILLAILAYYKHWPNILRLIHGNENKTYLKKKKA